MGDFAAPPDDARARFVRVVVVGAFLRPPLALPLPVPEPVPFVSDVVPFFSA